MAAAASQTRIVNKALTLLGTLTRITAITDGSPAAKTALALWDETRDEVLADHPWNFALGRDSLPVSGDYTPEHTYTYAYELPGDCLRWLPPRADDDVYFAGEQEGQYILSNAEAPIDIRYIRRVEDVARWAPGFTEALTAKLAFYMAKPITGQGSMMDRMGKLYGEALSAAKRADGLASGRSQRRAEYRSNWLAARTRPYGA